MRGVFDIVGPVMIGPSSSHTAGAVRLGLMARKILGEPVAKARIVLHGSFAETYLGHGTDKALIAGIMGFAPDDERIRDALQLAQGSGMEFRFQKAVLDGAHPNTAELQLFGTGGRETRVRGASIGGGNILVTSIDGYAVELSGLYPALLFIHQDRPGIIAMVTRVMAKYRLNIANLRSSRQQRGGSALTVMELDDAPPEKVLEECRLLAPIEAAMSVPAIS